MPALSKNHKRDTVDLSELNVFTGKNMQAGILAISHICTVLALAPSVWTRYQVQNTQSYIHLLFDLFLTHYIYYMHIYILYIYISMREFIQIYLFIKI